MSGGDYFGKRYLFLLLLLLLLLILVVIRHLRAKYSSSSIAFPLFTQNPSPLLCFSSSLPSSVTPNIIFTFLSHDLLQFHHRPSLPCVAMSPCHCHLHRRPPPSAPMTPVDANADRQQAIFFPYRCWNFFSCSVLPRLAISSSIPSAPAS